MQITLEKIKFKNILSVGNAPITVNLSKNPMTLITGHNGNGKSTLIDAICFSLFGKPYRNINKPQLVNSVNEKDLLTEIWFKVGARDYRVVRGIKPNIFQIFVNGNTTPLNQDAKSGDYQKYLEDHILKCSFKTFTQIVVLGSASFTPFMQLKANDRRVIIEDILDIEIFSIMKNIAKGTGVSIKEEMRSTDNDVSLTREKLKLHEQLDDEEKEKKRKDKKKLQSEIHQHRKDIVLKQKWIKSTKKELEKEMTELKKLGDPHKDYLVLQGYEKSIKSNQKKVNKEAQFYHDHDDCPTCQQKIDVEFRDKKLVEMVEKSDKFTNGLRQLEQEKLKTKQSIKLYDDIDCRMTDLNDSINKRYNEIQISDNMIGVLSSQLDEINKPRTDMFKNSDELYSKLSELEKVYTGLKVKKGRYDIILNLLNDSGIKAKIIDKYLPVINNRVNKYLADMDFYCSFNLDTEFQETIKSRHRDRFSYTSFSEGEKKRIDLALLLTWRYVASLKNSVNVNLLFLDEIFDSSLDQRGVDDVMKVFSVLDNTNIFVVSHRGDALEDKFNNKIVVSKKRNFTEMEQE